MKLLDTLGYLLLLLVTLFVSFQIQQIVLQQTKTGIHHTVKLTLLRLLSFFVVFVQYWMLTRLFPTYLILLLLFASTFGLILYTLLGAVSGFTLKENEKKISALSAIWGVTQKRGVACIFLLISLVSVFGSAILSLWSFWKYPLGSPKAIVLIALFHFVLPQIVRIPLQLLVSWPTVTSEYLDDDLRNSYLSDSFSNIIYQTISLLFPLWLFQQELHESQWTLPPFWILLSIPLFAFILGALLPFFVGLYRYRSQSRSMDNWQADWLNDLSEINTMPTSEARENAFKDKLAELENEIKLRFSENNLFAYYQQLREADDVPLTTAAPPLSEVPITEPTGEPQAPEAPSDVTTEAKTTVVARRPLADPLRVAKQYLTGQIAEARQPPSSDPNQTLMSIVRENYANLVHWDIRFAYLRDLLQLYEVTVEGMTKDISKFIEARLKAVKEGLAARTPKKNIFAGSILTASSTIIIWLFKHYEPAITALVDKLVH